MSILYKVKCNVLLSGIPGLFFFIWQGVGGKVFSQTRDSIHALGERHPCLAIVCEKILPPTPASFKVKKIAGIAVLLLPLRIVLLFFLLLFGQNIAAKPVEIVMWHSLAGNLGEEIRQLVADFNQQQLEYCIKLIYKGEYTESLTNFAAAIRAKQPPAIIQIAEVGTALMLKPAGIIKPVEDLMDQQKITLPIADFFPELRAMYSEGGRLQALPLNISIPVIYYNVRALAKAGYQHKPFPRTWQEIEILAAKLKKIGFNCVYTSAYQSWVQIEAFAAIHGLPLFDEKNGKAVYDHPLIINHLARLQSWLHKHYFAYGGRTSDATNLFTSGRCPLFSQSSGSHVSLAKLTNFPLGMAPLPIDSEVNQSKRGHIIGGAALWAVAGQAVEVERGIAHFFAYLAAPPIQQRWLENTGYLPLGINGVYAAINLNPVLLPSSPAHLISTTNYTSVPLNQLRLINDEALEKIFAGIKTPKQAIVEAVRKADYVLYRFKRNNE